MPENDYICFVNKGEIDPRLIMLMGVNIKANDTAIGEFGTGLKMAIAVILRLGGTITIQSGQAEYTFTVKEEVIRNKAFGLIYMDQHSIDGDKFMSATTTALGFTTDLGRHWAPWMAYRELWSNCKDENGSVYVSNMPGEPEKARTKIWVQCPALIHAHEHREEYLISTTPIWANESLEIHPAVPNVNAIFYRGIRVATLAEHKTSVFTYNILSKEQLTEDRTLDLWTCSWRIANSLNNVDDKTIAENILLAPNSAWEATFGFDYVAEFSPAMREAIKLNRYNKQLNSTAGKRSRTLYFEDYAPQAVPMTVEHHQKIAQAMDVFTSFDVTLQADTIRVSDNTAEEVDTTMVHGNILWIRRDIIDGKDWFVHLLSRWKEPETDNYDNLWKTRKLAELMAELEPEHPALQSLPRTQAPAVAA